MRENDGHLQATINELYVGWLRAIAERKYDWFDRHLADDYSMTAHPFENVYLRNKEC